MSKYIFYSQQENKQKVRRDFFALVIDLFDTYCYMYQSGIRMLL